MHVQTKRKSIQQARVADESEPESVNVIRYPLSDWSLVSRRDLGLFLWGALIGSYVTIAFLAATGILGRILP